MKKIIIDASDSIQKILNSIEKDAEERIEIFLKKGIYREKIEVRLPNVTFVGEDKESTILDFDDANGTSAPEGGKYGTFRSASFSILEGGHGFRAENLTFRNSFDYGGCGWEENRQGVALRCDADRSIFLNCNFLGNQDTLLSNRGKQQYIDCYIEGHIDFIFGGAQAHFRGCRIFSKDRDGLKDDNGYVAAPSTLEDKASGFIFEECIFVSDAPEGSVYLARPWHPGKNPGHCPAALFIHCRLGPHINGKRWTSMSGFLPEDARFYECENYNIGREEQ